MLNICISVYYEFERTRYKICLFMFSLLFLGLIMTTPLCLSPLLRVNKADWFYLQLILMWGWFTIKTALPHGIQTGFADIYIYICMDICITERADLVVYHFGYLFLERNGFVMTILLLLILVLLPVGRDMYVEIICRLLCQYTSVILYIHVFHLCYIGKRRQSRKYL